MYEREFYFLMGSFPSKISRVRLVEDISSVEDELCIITIDNKVNYKNFMIRAEGVNIYLYYEGVKVWEGVLSQEIDVNKIKKTYLPNINTYYDNLQIYPYALSEEEIESRFSHFTESGALAVSKNLLGTGVPFDNENAYIGVGDGSQSFNKYQADLTGNNKVRSAMDSGSVIEMNNMRGSLAPYDRDFYIYTSGGVIVPFSNVCTLREEGRYRGCVAVEENTTNEINPNSWGTSWSEEWDIEQLDNYKFKITALVDSPTNWHYGCRTESINILANTDVTLSVYVVERSNSDLTVGVGGFGTIDNFEDNRAIRTINHSSDWNFKLATDCYNDGNTIKAGDYIIVEKAQIEKKSFATSFVDGSRGNGALRYNYSLPTEECTINMWVCSIHDLYSMPTGLNVGEGDRPFILKSGWNSNAILWYLNDGDQYRCILAGRTRAGTDNLNWNAYEWHMITLKYSQSENVFNIYIDGSPDATGNFPHNNIIVDDFYIGYQNANFLFDEVVILPYALSDSEILNYYNQGGIKAYPQRISSRGFKYKASFGPDKANFDWNEWGVFNARSGGEMLTRVVEHNGRKSNKHTWELEIETEIDAY